MQKYILLTIDVEDWFQVENFKGCIEFSTWSSFELRVEKNTELILDTLDAFPNKLKATFFILGWIAERLPDLVKKIHERGHELASHGIIHQLCTKMTQKNLMSDLVRSKTLLENITGHEVSGYRAPSFAVNDSIVNLIKQAGYTYDSSFNSFSGHGRYGKIDLSNARKTGSCFQMESGLFELPVTNLKLKGKTIPLGGGGYFRLYPFNLYKLGMKAAFRSEDAFVFYAHPWEFDPGQPRVKNASLGFRFRHYINLHHTESKLQRLIAAFSECKFITCSDYIKLSKEKTKIDV